MVIDTELLVLAGVLAVILSQFTEALIKPLIQIINLLLVGNKEKAKETAIAQWPMYLTLGISAALAWFTGWNIFPVFTLAPVIGRVLTCLGIGLSPSFLYDITRSMRGS